MTLWFYMISIPKPEVVRRVRTESRADTPTQSSVKGTTSPQTMDVDAIIPAESRLLTSQVKDSRPSPMDVSPIRPIRNIPSPHPITRVSSPRPDALPAAATRKSLQPQGKESPHPITPVQ